MIGQSGLVARFSGAADPPSDPLERATNPRGGAGLPP
jgi:hypothetical protein